MGVTGFGGWKTAEMNAVLITSCPGRALSQRLTSAEVDLDLPALVCSPAPYSSPFHTVLFGERSLPASCTYRWRLAVYTSRAGISSKHLEFFCTGDLSLSLIYLFNNFFYT